MSIHDINVGDEPMDRLTTLCKVMTDALDDALDKEREADMAAGAMNDGLSAVRGIIFLNDAEKGGIQMFGYEDLSAGMADLMIHLKAMFTSMGKDFGILTDQGVLLLDDGPEVLLRDEPE